jgi:hypothetical protein
VAKRGLGIALLLTAVVVGLWLFDRDAPDRTVARDAPDAPVERQPVHAPRPDAPPVPEPKPAADPPATPAPPDVEPEPDAAYVAGRVVDERGRPMPGIEVVAETPGWYCVEPTDANGRFRLRTRGQTADVGFATYPGPRWNKVMAPAHVLKQVRPGTVGLMLTFRGIEGRFEGDRARGGIAVARCEGQDELVAIAPLDDALHFAFYGLAAGMYRLSYKTGTAGIETTSVEGGRDVPAWRTGVVLHLKRGDTIEGIVLDGNGEPSAGIWVRTTAGTTLTGDRTDLDGRFVVEGLDPGREYRLTTWRNGYVPEVREGIRAGARGVQFTLDPGLRSTGRVVDARGEPVKLASLSVRVCNGPSLPSWAQAGPDGRFELGGLPEGTMEVTVRMHKRLATFTFRAGDRDLVFVLK